MNVVITGGSGFIGQSLIDELQKAGHRATILSRHPARMRGKVPLSVPIEQWDGRTPGEWARSIDGADAVVNLAGESLASGRWTESRKKSILESRVHATQAIVEAIRRAKVKPQVLVNASAVGYYGHVESGDVTEDAPQGSGFLAEVCGRWEHEAMEADALGVRVVRVRFGVALDDTSVALKKMLTPFKLFVGGPLGSGKQWFPWVHREDVAGIILFALAHRSLAGAVNAAAPDAVTMREFTTTLGAVIHRPSWAPVPAFVLRAALGEMSEMIVTGQKVVPKKLEEAGYRFRYPKLRDALRESVR